MFRALLAILALLLPWTARGQGLEEKPFAPPPLVVKGMTAALSDANEEVAAFAVRRLGDWRRPEVAGEIVKLTGPETPAVVRDAALVYFTRIGEAARPHLGALLRLLGDENAHVRELVLAAHFSAKATAAHLDAIALLLEDPRVEVRSLAADCLGQAGPAARAHLPALRKGLGRARTGEFRRAVLTAMEDIGGLSLADGESFVPFLRDKEDAVRVAAFGALQKVHVEAAGSSLDPKAKSLGEAARAQFARENSEVRAAMIEGAVRNQALADALMGELAALVEKGSPEVQAAALTALAMAREHALPRLPLVAAKLEDADPEVRSAAFRALRMMGPKAVAPHLNAVAHALQHESPRVRNEALLALPVAGEALRNFPYRIRTALLDATPGVRNTLLKAAGVLVETVGVDEEWLAQGREALASPDADMRTAMCLVASRFGLQKGAPLFPHLVALLKDPDAGVRGAAAVALRAFATEDTSRATLREAFRPLLKDPESDVRWAALDTIFELDPAKDPALVGEIAALMDDEEESVRSAAVRALGAGGAAARPHLPRIVRFLNEDPAAPSYAVVETVLRLAPLNARELVLLLQSAFVYGELIPLTRTTAYAATGGAADGVLLVRLIGRSTGSVERLIPPAEVPRATALLREILPAKDLHPRLKLEIEARLAELAKLPR